MPHNEAIPPPFATRAVVFRRCGGVLQGDRSRAYLGGDGPRWSGRESARTSVGRYEVRGTDQAAIRPAFTAKTLTFFAENHGWSVQTLGGAAIVFRGDKVCAPAEVPRFLADALTVLGAFPVNG